MAAHSAEEGCFAAAVACWKDWEVGKRGARLEQYKKCKQYEALRGSGLTEEKQYQWLQATCLILPGWYGQEHTVRWMAVQIEEF
mmetsp:Transcript_36136/g.91297  ORF Transcript_36136/g.91297 Transcript_36136/m.91297 type:complete len:84 (-) Transcript_36136:114-365(-)